MNPEQLETALQLAAGIAGRFGRRVWWSSVEDMEQTALLAMVEAARTFDPAVGMPWKGYARAAAVRAIWYSIWRDSAPVSAGQREVRNLAGLHRQDLDSHAGMTLPAADAWPDQAYDSADWHTRAAAVIADRLAAMGDGAAIALEVLIEEERPRHVAARHGMDASKVHRLAAQARRRIAMDPYSYELWKELPLE